VSTKKKWGQNLQGVNLKRRDRTRCLGVRKTRGSQIIKGTGERRGARDKCEEAWRESNLRLAQ